MRDLDALIAFLEARSRTPFAWGRSKNDCVSYGVAGVKAQTGRDVLKGSGLLWGSKAGALRVLRKVGGLEKAIGRYLDEIPTGSAMRGDVALIDGDAGPLLGIVEGETIAGPGPAGTMRVPRAAMRRAWSATPLDDDE